MAEGEALPRIDHIIIGAQDLNAAVEHFKTEFGLAGYEGGKHQGGWGTENYIIPLGAGYIEIAAVWDPEAAQSCDWGKYIANTPIQEGGQPWKLMTFCVQTKDDAADISKRLDHMLGHMVRLRPDGSKLTWRVAAMSKFDAPGREAKPFFITWDNPEIRPDKFPAPHTAQPLGIEYVEVAGDRVEMLKWIGTDADKLALKWADGPPGFKSVGIKTADGKTIVLT